LPSPANRSIRRLRGRAFRRSGSAFGARRRGRRSSCGGFGFGLRLGCGLFFEVTRRRNDRRHREVAVADDRLDAFRQFHRRDVQRLADLEAGEVGFDEFRNLLDRANEFDGVAHDVERAAALDARRFFRVDEFHRNGDAQRRARRDALEVDMRQRVTQRIKLKAARNDLMLGAVEIDVDQRGQEVTDVETLGDFAEFERNRHGGFLVAVDHGRHLACAARSASGPLADSRTRDSLQYCFGSHDFILCVVLAPPPGVRGVKRAFL
jgi:hypothetical protein